MCISVPRESTPTLTQQVSNPKEPNPQETGQPPEPQRPVFAKRRLIPLLALLGLLIILSTSFFIGSLLQPQTPQTSSVATTPSVVPTQGKPSHGKAPTVTPTYAISPTLSP